MRLIDADELLENLTPDPIAEAGCPEPEWLEEFARIIREAPTVEYHIREGDKNE